MREATRRIATFKRTETARTINDEAALILGVTAKDFGLGVLILIGIAMLPSFFAPFVAVAVSVAVVFLKTRYRSLLPPRFLAHATWAYGLLGRAPRKGSLRARLLGAIRRLRLLPPPKPFSSPFARVKRRLVSFVP